MGLNPYLWCFGVMYALPSFSFCVLCMYVFNLSLSMMCGYVVCSLVVLHFLYELLFCVLFVCSFMCCSSV